MPTRQLALILIGIFFVAVGIGFPLHLYLRGEGWARSEHARSMALQLGVFSVVAGLLLLWVNVLGG